MGWISNPPRDGFIGLLVYSYGYLKLPSRDVRVGFVHEDTAAAVVVRRSAASIAINLPAFHTCKGQ